MTGVASTTSSSSSSLLSGRAGGRVVVVLGRKPRACGGTFARSPEASARGAGCRRAWRGLRREGGVAAGEVGLPRTAARAFSLSIAALSSRYSPYISRIPGAARASSLLGWRPCVRAKSTSHVLRRTRTVSRRAASSPPAALGPGAPDVDAGARSPAMAPRGASIPRPLPRALDYDDRQGVSEGTSDSNRLTAAVSRQDLGRRAAGGAHIEQRGSRAAVRAQRTPSPPPTPPRLVNHLGPSSRPSLAARRPRSLPARGASPPGARRDPPP